MCPPIQSQPASWHIQGYKKSEQGKDEPHAAYYIATENKKNQTAKKKDDGKNSGAPSWLCQEIKITDLAVIFFAYIVALLTWFQLRSARANERAYIYGGGPYGDRIRGAKGRRETEIHRPDDFSDWKRLTVQNYGKTPGIITKVEWGLYPIEKFPRGKTVTEIIKMIQEGRLPDAKLETDSAGEFIPPTEGADWLPYRRVAFFRSQHADKIFFGKISYRDVFGELRYSTFKLHLNKSGFSDPFDGGYDDED